MAKPLVQVGVKLTPKQADAMGEMAREGRTTTSDILRRSVTLFSNFCGKNPGVLDSMRQAKEDRQKLREAQALLAQQEREKKQLEAARVKAEEEASRLARQVALAKVKQPQAVIDDGLQPWALRLPKDHRDSLRGWVASCKPGGALHERLQALAQAEERGLRADPDVKALAYVRAAFGGFRPAWEFVTTGQVHTRPAGA